MDSFNKKVVLFLVTVFGVLNCAELLAKDQCTTPDSKLGQCIRINECKGIIEFIKNYPKPIPETILQKLRGYMCGYEGTVTKVCCPFDPINFGEGDNLPIPPPPDITDHKNLHLLPEDCGLIDTDDKIRNGENAKLLEFPWMALLSYNTSKGIAFNCGGTIINERYILTAAHCIVHTPKPLVGVHIGEFNISSEKDCDDKKCVPPVQNLTIEDIIPHPEYNITLYANDIGLIRVPKMNLQVENVKSVCLPTIEETRNQKFNNAIVTGWGFTNNIGRTATILQKVQLPIQNLSACINAYRHIKQVKLSYKQLCVGGTSNKDSCGGDSGGPLHSAAYFNDEFRYVQQGIVSVGYARCGTIGFPGLYTRVAYYMKWILDTIKP